MNQNVSTAVMQRRLEPDDSLDDFPTPPWATRALIEHVIRPHMSLPLRGLTVSDPACNRGYMARPLAEYFGHVHASDILDYGWAGQQAVADYLYPGAVEPAPLTITNPPFRLAEEFILKSLNGPNWIGTAVIVRNAFMEGVDRYQKLFLRHPPTIYAQFVERVIMTKGIVRDPSKQYWDEAEQKWRRPSTATSYCWLVWLRDVPRQPPCWIPPCRASLERAGDYGTENQDETGAPNLFNLADDGVSSRALSANLVSDGACEGSLPSGEIEPSVMLACAPSDITRPEAVPFGFDTVATAPGGQPADDEEGRRQALAAIAAGETLEWSVVRDLVGVGYVHATTSRLVITEEGEAFLKNSSEPDRSSSNTVVGKHGGTSAAVPDARSDDHPDRASTPFDYPEMPEFLKRNRSAA
jgi:hypothetical protein